MKTSIVALAVLGAVALPVIGQGQGSIIFGGNRTTGMGGAGLALPIDVAQNFNINPAFLAYGNKGFSIQWPRFGYRLDGLSIGDIGNLVSSANSAGISGSDLTEIARKFGSNDLRLGLFTGFGISFAGLAISASAEAGVNSFPNQSLANWSNGGGQGAAPGDTRLDALGYGSAQVNAAYGNTVKTKAGKLSLGLNARRVRAYYATGYVDASNVNNNSAGTVTNSEADGFGVDVGALYSPQGMDNVFFGLMINNFIEPNVSANFAPPPVGAGQPSPNRGSGTFNPFARQVSIGSGYMHKNLLVAADIVDIAGNANGREFRLGGELRFGSFAVRTGYNSRTAWTLGAEVFGLNIQFAGAAPFTVNSLIRF